MHRFKPIAERELKRMMAFEIPEKLYERLKDLSRRTLTPMRTYLVNWIEHGLAKEDSNAGSTETIEEIRRKFE